MQAQITQSKCGTMDYLNTQMQEDPTLESRMQLQEEELQQWLKENKDWLNKKSTITIPIVVHVIYKVDSQNVSDEQVHRQIAALNKSFSGQSDQSMQAFSDDLKANTEIQFCLASVAPDGSPTSGIERRQTGREGFQNDAVKFYDYGGLDAWDPNSYLNIWVCNYNYSDGTSYIFSAYAQFPGTGVNETYGVVIRFGAFGLDDSTYFRGSGAILSHEIGHCFNLRHIWGDDGTECTGSDYCDDTPNQAGRTQGKHYGALTDDCTVDSPGIMYMNYMDYSDDVIYANFTPDQKDRMQANFDASNGVLYALSQSTACGAVASTNSYQLESPFQVFPNPTSSELILRSGKNLIGQKFIVYDYLGHILTEGLISADKISIDLGFAKSGVYFIKLEGRAGIYKFIKD